jgi:glycosyltransferase involved in cell wall biosynthesis
MLSVIIPAYNEENSIYQVLNKIIHVKLSVPIEICVINDASTDNTLKIIQNFMEANPKVDIKVYSLEKNQGKGAAIRKGIELATGDYVIIQDADLELDPNEYPYLLKPILEGHADVVYGSRFIGDKPHRVTSFWHNYGNRLLTFISNFFTNLYLTDMETCYKVFKSEIIKKITIEENRFGFEPEITAKLAKIKGIRIYEVGISYYARTHEQGKKIKWTDGFRAIWCILKYNLFR